MHMRQIKKKLMKRVILILLVFLTFGGAVSGRKLAALTEILKPRSIVIDDRQIYILEKKTIFIYSLNDFKLKKKFGNEGEGPQEFKGTVHITPMADHLFINSAGKISFFSKDGNFIREMKSPTGFSSVRFCPLDNGFVGRGSERENGIYYVTVNFFDPRLKKGKELYRMKAVLQPAGKIELLKQPFIYQTYENVVYVAGKKGFIIDVLDHTGKPVFSINREYEKRKFTPRDEKEARDALRLLYKQQYEVLKNRLAFPDYFPGIADFLVIDNKIYVSTWKIEKNNNEFFIFDLKGKLMKRLFIPMVFMMPLEPYPYTIKKGTFFQLIETEDEIWELHADDIN